MILYDSNAYESGMVGKFEGRRSWDKDKSVCGSVMGIVIWGLVVH